mgnify:CR=1 FL=1|tara:strand:+ start:23762 stop:25810 length:2049 start_codon:yes stop_codon:yes gene_type:complete
MVADDKYDFGDGDRDSVLRELIKHDNSHLGPSLVDRQQPTSTVEVLHPRGYNYWSEITPNPPTGVGISMVVAPSWGIIFPPYGTARLTGLLRHYGHRVVVHDVNISAYHHVLKNNYTNWWNSIYYYSWELPTYYTDVHPKIKPVLDKAVKNILNDDTELIGFSVYQTSILATLYMIKEIKEKAPHKKIAVGGPEAFNDWFEDTVEDLFQYDPCMIDFRVTGEGEQELLTILENLNSYPTSNNTKPLIMGGFKSRLSLEELPFPDYTDYDLSLYEHPDGTSIETSRGCVAKCTFCAETHFWKFRSTSAERTIEEMKHQINKYGVRRFWFVDSLANGNFKEFKKLIQLLKDEKLEIRWNSYARNDGRMDLQMFKDIRETGCATLSFGVESGSQVVLDAMKKKVEVWEIEANLKDGKQAGMQNHCNWIVGFPTEGRQEFMHSMALLWNTRKDMFAISPGYTCGDAPFSEMQLNWQSFDIAWKEKIGDNRFLSNWFTKDYANTILHRFIRLKFTNIWLNLMKDNADGTVINTQRRPSLQDSYKFTPLTNEYNERIEQTQETFNYFIDKTSLSKNLSCTLANEYTVFAWLLYKAFGAHSFEMKCSPEIDLPEFGTFVTNNYWSSVKWTVDKTGIINSSLTHRFEHKSLKDDTAVEKYEIPFGTGGDMSFKNNTIGLNNKNIEEVANE